jgi:predicted TIM-barrel fold metal-dependent hydrolase
MCSVLGAYHDASLTAEEREKILFGNARRVFNLQ